MLSRAHEQGFHLYCLSEHVPRKHTSQLYPEEVDAGIQPADLLQRFEDYLVEARRCAQHWKGTMQVLVGAELENIDGGCIEYLQTVLNGHKDDVGGERAGKGRVDYLVGSLHHVDSIPIDFDRKTFQSALDTYRLEGEEATGASGNSAVVFQTRAHLRLVLSYLDRQHSLIEHFKPEVVGHFDLCRLFQPGTPMTTASSLNEIEDKESQRLLQQVEEAVCRNVQLVCSYGGLFEVNSASIRKGWPTPYPGEDVMDVILANQGRLCLSDDAHSHEQVGLNFYKVKQYLEAKGVQDIWKLQLDSDEADGTAASTTTDSTLFARGVRTVKVTGWASEPFWKRQAPV